MALSFDFHAAFPAVSTEELRNLLKEPPGRSAMALVRLLAQTAASEETKLTGIAGHQQVVRSPAYRKELDQGSQLLDRLRLGAPEVMDWQGLPEFCCYVRIDFRLGSPYLGRDDRAFSVTENPVRKEVVFGVPFISSTTWKGALRHACNLSEVARLRTERLFGPEHNEEEETRAAKGLVLCYPSFFTSVGFEIINPHDRARRIGKNPIRLECVPKEAESRFAVLYVPRWPLAKGEVTEEDSPRWADRRSLIRSVAEDLAALIDAVDQLLRDHGISAKRSSGYGEILPKLFGKRGIVAVNHRGVPPAPFDDLSQLVKVRERILGAVGRLL